MGGETKASRLAAEIATWIDHHQVAAGTPLGTKAEMLEQHRVSRQTLNEALRLLQGRGLVTVKPGPRGGTFVAPAVDRIHLSMSLTAAQDDPRQLDDLFQVQDALHELVCVAAAVDCSAAAAQRILRAAETLAAASGSAERLRAMWEVDRQIARALRNGALASVYVMILDQIITAVRRWPLADAVSDRSVEVHLRMAAAVASNDVSAARAASHDHSPVDPRQAAGSARD